MADHSITKYMLGFAVGGAFVGVLMAIVLGGSCV